MQPAARVVSGDGQIRQAGCDDLTALALDLGHSSHSHLTASQARARFRCPRR